MAEYMHIYYIGRTPVDSGDEQPFLVQRWYEDGESVADTCQLSLDDKLIIFDMFEAYSHFVYHRSKGLLVHTNLQERIIHTAQVMVFDVTTHVR